MTKKKQHLRPVKSTPLLEVLLAEDANIAAIAAALVVCDHTLATGVDIDKGGTLYWCPLCGAAAHVDRGDPRPPAFSGAWQRAEIAASHVTVERLQAVSQQAYGLIELHTGVVKMHEELRAQGDYACATVEECRDLVAKMAVFRAAVAQVLESPLVQQYKRVDRAIDAIRAGDKN